jgi:hypothetical protein
MTMLKQMGVRVNCVPYPMGRFTGRRESVESIDCNNLQINDEDLTTIWNAFPELERLKLANTRITDQTIVNLGPMRSLTFLDLSDTAVSDQAIAHLSELPKLQSLDLLRTEITDAALASVRKMSSLEYLTLNETLVSRDAVRTLANERPSLKIEWSPRGGWRHRLAAKRIRELGGSVYADPRSNGSEYVVICNDRWHGGIDGLVSIGDLENVVSVAIKGNWFVNDGIGILTATKGLKKLVLYRTGVTSEGLLRLKEFPGLKECEITDGALYREAISSLRQRSPDLKITVVE